MGTWREIKSHGFTCFDTDELCLFERNQTEYQLRWRDKRRNILSPELMREFCAYLKKHKHKCLDELKIAENFIRTAQKVLKDTKEGLVGDDKYFKKWTKCYFLAKDMTVNWRKFKLWRNAKAYKRKSSEGTKKRLNKKTISFTTYQIIIDPNIKQSVAILLDGRYNAFDFDFIEDFYLYLKEKCRQTPESLINNITNIKREYISRIEREKHNQQRHIDLWEQLVPQLTQNKEVLARFLNWRNKTASIKWLQTKRAS
ncbi:hypothetical protein AN214_00327 [Pseudoalteromonas sp. P1-9]|uniref:hypothetical protein n=1 Tax=Pseudoalteromonas sp. P1-9 TaxID=1710354 RepID=UPI0006D5D4A0|nr:hypothetical protein [Pseudoalteromonas sp. P1-9]KPV97941.1 hypothetical protein AN214_00327 [Pseudoalteromonas sp. P1-9]